MWLMNYITNSSHAAPKAVRGELNVSEGSGTAVTASGEHKQLELCFPYGLVSVPPSGEQAVVLPLDEGEVGLGVIANGVGLEPGELMLYSKGGASVILKNDGRVLINGREAGND